MSMLASSVPLVDPVLARLIASVESNNDLRTIRFERRIFNRITDQGSSPVIIAIQRIHNCSSDTARIIYSTSWGKYQIMGFNLFAANKLTTCVFDFMASSAMQDQMFGLFLNDKDINVSWNALKLDNDLLTHFAVTYNGSSVYADRMKAVAKELKL